MAISIWQRLRIPVSIIFGMVVFGGLATCQSHWREAAPLMATIILGVGLILASIGAFGRAWCAVYAAGYKNKVLITEGPYSMCRNPLYFFSLVGAIGTGLSTQTFTVPLVILGVFSVYYPLVMRSEALILRGIHGEAYDAYRARVPAFFPTAKLVEPTSYTVRPRILRRHLRSAIWFVWAVAVILTFAEFRSTGVLPSFLHIY